MFWRAAEPNLKAKFYGKFYQNICLSIHLSANPTKWSNTLKQFVYNLSNNYLSVFDHFIGLVLKGLSAATDLVISTDVFKGYIRQIFHKMGQVKFVEDSLWKISILEYFTPYKETSGMKWVKGSFYGWRTVDTLFAIWYQFVQFNKREKHPWKSVTFCTLLKATLFLGCFSRFLNCATGIKSRKASQQLSQLFCKNYLCGTQVYSFFLLRTLQNILLDVLVFVMIGVSNDSGMIILSSDCNDWQI